MMIAVGTDLVDVTRLERRLAASPLLAARVLSDRERQVCAGRPASLAARWAAKEAVLKAMGSALAAADTPVPAGWHYTDIEVAGAPGCPPHLELHGVVADTAQHLGITAWHLSLSHDAGAALAFVVAEGQGRSSRSQTPDVTPR